MRRWTWLVTLASACGGGTSGDAGCPADALACDASTTDAPHMDAPRDTSIPCGTSAWSTYGHDAQRTFASDGCIRGPLTANWTYTPMPAMGHTRTAVFHAIAQTDAVFLQWRQNNAMYLGTTSLDRVSTMGMRVWNFDTGTDTNLGNWASIALGSVVLQDDGIYFVNPADGTRLHDQGVDWWGQTAPDPNRLYVAQNAHIDGPGVFVGATDATGHPLWQHNQYGMCRIDVTDMIGAIAVDGATLFYAADYHPGTSVTLPFHSGLFAFDGATGMPRWNHDLVPTSAISAAMGKVFIVESGMLEARNQSDGTVAWMASVSGAGAQAPVIAGARVIVAGGNGVMAFDAASGQLGWMHPLSGAAAQPTSIQFSGGCAGLIPEGGPTVTSLAAALASNTLVVTAFDGIHVLSLEDGSEQWQGSPAMATPHDPVIVGHTLYVIAGESLVSLQAM